MCTPVILPILTGLAAGTTVAQQLGIIGNRNQGGGQSSTAQFTGAPGVRSPGPAATRGEDPERVKTEDESAVIKQSKKQRSDKLRASRGLGGLGAAPAINTPTTTPPSGVNLG